MTSGVHNPSRLLGLALMALAVSGVSTSTVAAAEMTDVTDTTELTKAGAMRAKPKMRKPVVMQREMQREVPPSPLEMPIPLGHNWGGFYAGGFLGGAHALWTDDFYRNNNHGHAELPIDGFEGGAWVGYNMYLSPKWIAGAEADLGLSNASETTEVFDNDLTYASVNHFGSLRGRLGYVMDNVMLYGTAGLAFANLTEDLQKGRNAGEQLVRDNMYHWGYTLGGGAEYAFTDRWVGRLEYLYSKYNQDSFRNADGQLAEFNNQLHQVRVGVSYKF